jgi:hypothetical protein
MADPVAFVGVEKQYLVRLSCSLVMPQMPEVYAAVRKDQLCRGGAFFSALLPVAALAAHVRDGYDGSFQQTLNGKFGQDLFQDTLPASAEA